MNNIIAVESADGRCSLAWLRDGVCTVLHNAQMQDSLSWMGLQLEQLRLEAGLDLKQIDGIACSVGPGGFTGVRVAVGYCQGLGMAIAKPVWGVSSLDGLAWRLGQQVPLEQTRLRVSLDARMGELYAAAYVRADKQWLRVGDEQLIAPQVLRAELDVLSGPPPSLGGPGFEAYQDVFTTHVVPSVRVDAEAIARLAQAQPAKAWCNAADLAPTYLRNKVAETLAERAARAAEL